MPLALETLKRDTGYRITIEPATWQRYTEVLAELDASGRRYRSTYLDGILEVLVPGNIHEAIKKAIARLLEEFSTTTGIDVDGLGSTTFKDKLKQLGLEPDECFYITTPMLQPGKTMYDKGIVLPPPDLAVEVDITSTSLPRETVYAELGVRELWRWRDDQIAILTLAGNKYAAMATSAVLPELPMNEFRNFVCRAVEHGKLSKTTREWRAWLEANPIRSHR